jgi:hypothetical protein
VKNIQFKDEARPLEAEELAEWQTALEMTKLPVGYWQFLLSTNGGRPTSDFKWFKVKNPKGFVEGFNGVMVDCFLSVKDKEHPNCEILQTAKTFTGRIPSDTLPIADDPFGNLILLGVGEGNFNEVFLWDHEVEGYESPEDEYHNVGKLADSFEEFIEGLGKPPDFN